MAGWDDVSAPVAAPQTSGWDAVSAPVQQPKMPDTSAYQQIVKDNLAANDNKEVPESGEPKPPATLMQQAETGTGLPLQKILSGSAKDSDINEANRTAYNAATKNGSVPDGPAWLQTVLHATLPIIAGAARTNQYTGNALEGAKEDIFNALKPFKADNVDDSAIRKGIEGLGQYVGGPVFGVLGASASPITGGISAHSRSLTNLLQPNATEEQKQNLDQAIGGAITNVLLAAVPTLHGFVGKAPVEFSAGDGPWSNLPGKEIITDHLAKPLGKESGQVTSDEIDNAISKGGKDLFPHPKDFEAVSTVMDSSLPHERVSIENAKTYNFETGKSVIVEGYNGQNKLRSDFKDVEPNFFTTDFDTAKSYTEKITKEGEESPNVRHATIRMDNPKVVDGEGLTWDKFAEKNNKTIDIMAADAIRDGHDGLIVKNIKDHLYPKEDTNPSNVYVSFGKNKINKTSQSTLDTLHQIYEKTGKRPEQVFEDARHDSSIAEDIGAGKIPRAYSRLLSPMRPDIEAMIKGVEEKAAAEKQEPVTPATSKEYAEDLYNRLHQKLGQDTATDIESMQRELQTKKVLGEDLDKEFYLKKEDESIPLTEEKQKLYDQYVKPLGEQERALYEKARALGAEDVEPVSESYVHRIVKGKGHYLDKYDTEFGEDENIGFGKPTRSLSQSTAALEEAQFHALVDAEGNRKLQMGEIPKGYKAGDTWTDETGKDWTIKRAKTEEIEKNTDLQYYKSAIGNTEDNIRKLEKTIRNIEFLNSLKGDMEKTGLGVPASESYHPQGYQQVNIPQLRGWSFDPRVAEVLNDIYDKGGDSLLGRINNVLIKGMFLNPIPHVENVFYDYLASRGWKNTKAIKGADYIAQGVKDVKEFSPEYLDVLKRGGALKLPGVWKQDFFNQMERQFISEMQQSKEGLDLAKSWGFDSVPHLAESVFNQSQKALWGSGDAFLMAKIRELKDSGMSTDKAIEEAQKHIVDYRIPPRVGESILGPQLSRMLSKSLQGNGIVVFTRYHYGLFKSLGNMVSELAGGIKEMDATKVSRASGQLFATYFLLSVVNPAIADMWSSMTGQKEKVRSPGVTGLFGAISDFVSGKRSLGQALKSQFVVSPGVQVGADLLNDKIVDKKLGHEGVQLMDYLMKQPTMSIPAIPYNIREGKQSGTEEGLRQIGVTPDKEYKEKKPSRRAIQKLENEERGLLGND